MAKPDRPPFHIVPDALLTAPSDAYKLYGYLRSKGPGRQRTVEVVAGNDELVALLSRRKLPTARSWLEAHGWINYAPGTGRRAGRYTVYDECGKTREGGTERGPQGDTEGGTKRVPLRPVGGHETGDRLRERDTRVAIEDLKSVENDRLTTTTEERLALLADHGLVPIPPPTEEAENGDREGRVHRSRTES